MWFDAQAKLARLRERRETEARDPATIATTATQNRDVAEVAAHAGEFLTSTTPARDKQCVSWMSCRGEKSRLNSADAVQRSTGQSWFIPAQVRETLVPSSDALDVGKTSVGMFGKAAAPDTKTNEDKAATASGRAKESENDAFIGNPQFLKTQCEISTSEVALPCVNFRQYEKAKLTGGSGADTRSPATTATIATPVQRPAPIVAIVASVATPCDEASEALQLRDEALKDLDAATDVANILLERLRGCETPAAVATFLDVYQPAIDALEAHAAVRKIHIHNLADYKKEQFR